MRDPWPAAWLLGRFRATETARARDLFSAAVEDMPFIDPRFVPLAGPTDAVGILVFLVSAALIIALMEVARCAIRARIRPAPCGNGRTGVVFSLEKGSRGQPGMDAIGPQRLGPDIEVAEMMQDFLTQIEIGKRLNNRGA